MQTSWRPRATAAKRKRALVKLKGSLPRNMNTRRPGEVPRAVAASLRTKHFKRPLRDPVGTRGLYKKKMKKMDGIKI